jgi:hypothetical protein
LLVNNVILEYSILICCYEMSYKETQCKKYNGLNNQQKNLVIMRVEKQIKVLLCFSPASNLAFKICYELNNCYLVLVLWEQLLFMLLPSSIIDGWIIINIVGKIDIYNTDAKGCKTKNFTYLKHRRLSHIGNKI